MQRTASRRASRSASAVCLVVLTASALSAAGCVSTQALDSLELANAHIAATAAIPPAPFVHHQMLAAARVYPHDPNGRPAAGTASQEQAQVERVEAVLQTAAERVDVPARIAEGLVTALAHTHAAAVSPSVDEAAYILDVRVLRYGLGMRSTHLPASFFIELEASLVEQATGDVVWTERVERDRLSLTGRLTAAELAHLSDERMQAELTALAQTTTELLTRDLLRAAR